MYYYFIKKKNRSDYLHYYISLWKEIFAEKQD